VKRLQFLHLFFGVCDACLQKLSPKTSSEYETLPGEEDLSKLSEEVYYSDEDANDLLQSGDAVTNAAAAAAAHLPNSSRPTEMHHDHSALLSQLTNGEFPSPATIELAVAQLMEALTGDERQLMTQLMQQMGVMNPVLAAANPLALQVEAIRMILTTRGQRALLQLSQPALQQMALQAQLQNLTQFAGAATTATEPASARAQTETYPPQASAAAAAAVNHDEDVASLRSHHLSDISEHRVPVQSAGSCHSVTLDTEQKYPDDCSSVLSSNDVWLDAGATRLARDRRGIGRGRSLSGHNDETCRQDRPRGRGLRRVKTPGACPAAVDAMNASQPGSGSASARQPPPLVPPPLHTTQSVQRPAANSSEDWEEEIDQFSPEMFHVESSFFKSGGKR